MPIVHELVDPDELNRECDVLREKENTKEHTHNAARPVAELCQQRTGEPDRCKCSPVPTAGAPL